MVKGEYPPNFEFPHPLFGIKRGFPKWAFLGEISLKALTLILL